MPKESHCPLLHSSEFQCPLLHSLVVSHPLSAVWDGGWGMRGMAGTVRGEGRWGSGTGMRRSSEFSGVEGDRDGAGL